MKHIYNKVNNIFEEWYTTVEHNSSIAPNAVYEIFKNPSRKEFFSAFILGEPHSRSLDGCRGIIIYETQDIYVWNAHLLHDHVIKGDYLDIDFDNTLFINVSIDRNGKATPSSMYGGMMAKYSQLVDIAETFNKKQAYVNIHLSGVSQV